MGALDLLLLTLATWRLSHLVAVEHGPFDVFDRLRRRAGAVYSVGRGWDAVNPWGRLLSCPLCLSVWFAPALIAGYVILAPWFTWAVWWLAVSGGACVLQEGVTRA